MKIYKENDKSKAVCENCNGIVNTTFQYANFKHEKLIIPDILQGFCDKCGASVSIPHQSTFKIKSYRVEKDTLKKEFRIPSHLNDVILSIGVVNNIGCKPNTICRAISKYYISKLKQKRHKGISDILVRSIKDDLAKGPVKGRLSCVFNADDYDVLKASSKRLKISEANIMKGIIVSAKHEFLDKENSKSRQKLIEIANQF